MVEVNGPGKFEGQPLWIEEAYSLAMDGVADVEWGDSSVGGYHWAISVDNDLHEKWGMKELTDYVVLIEDSQGFITHVEAMDYDVWSMEVDYEEQYGEMDTKKRRGYV